jgi:integrase
MVKDLHKFNIIIPGELEKLAIEFEREVERGIALDGNIKLKQFTDRWLEEYAEGRLSLRTLESYKHELDSKILPALGHIRLDKLTPVQKFMIVLFSIRIFISSGTDTL